MEKHKLDLESRRLLLTGGALTVGAAALLSPISSSANQTGASSCGVANVLDYGAKGDGSTDDTAAIQLAIDSTPHVYMPAGDYVVSDTIVLGDGSKLEGAGHATRIIGSDPSKPVLMTFDGVTNNTNENQIIRDLNIRGAGKCAVAFVHHTVSSAENITLEGFNGQDGFVFEYGWGNRYASLKTNGATLTGAAFKFNKVVIDMVCDLFYMSNHCDYGIYMSKEAVEYSVGSSSGHGVINFHNPTIQGANEVGVYVDYVDVTFNSMYTENNERLIQVGKGGSTTSNIRFYSCRLIGGRANGENTITIEESQSVSFYDCSFDPNPIILGGGLKDIHFYSPRLTWNKDILDHLYKRNDTTSAFPVSIYGQHSRGHSEMILKSYNYGWNMQRMHVNSNGEWVAESWVPQEYPAS